MTECRPTADPMIRFSVCIPNYNYARYLEQTIRSVLDQGRDDVEVCVSDNASTDDSVQVVGGMHDGRVKLSVNPSNLGFAANLDCAVRMSSGRTVITLSSDDLMLPGALDAYAQLLDGVDDQSVVVGSTIRVVDSGGGQLGRVAASPRVWESEHRDGALTAAIGRPVYGAPAREILARSIRRMRNPVHFATFAFPRRLYDVVGGYGGQRLVNPDKWFHWRMLSEATQAYFINDELFAYRWHDQNQTAQQQSSGALKFLVDEYVSTFQLDPGLLAELGMSREEVVRAYVHNDVVLRGLRNVADGERAQARRAVHWALATYPAEARRSAAFWGLRLACASGPLGTAVGRTASGRATALWRRRLTARDDLHETWAPQARR